MINSAEAVLDVDTDWLDEGKGALASALLEVRVMVTFPTPGLDQGQSHRYIRTSNSADQT